MPQERITAQVDIWLHCLRSRLYYVCCTHIIKPPHMIAS